MDETTMTQIIASAGVAKSDAFEALDAAMENDFDTANRKIKDSREEILKAHNLQTSLMRADIVDGDIKISILLIHAQDLLMTTMLAQDLIEKMIIYLEKKGGK